MHFGCSLEVGPGQVGLTKDHELSGGEGDLLNSHTCAWQARVGVRKIRVTPRWVHCGISQLQQNLRKTVFPANT